MGFRWKTRSAPLPTSAFYTERSATTFYSMNGVDVIMHIQPISELSSFPRQSNNRSSQTAQQYRVEKNLFTVKHPPKLLKLNSLFFSFESLPIKRYSSRSIHNDYYVINTMYNPYKLYTIGFTSSLVWSGKFTCSLPGE